MTDLLHVLARGAEDLRVEAARRLDVPLELVTVRLSTRPGEPVLTISIHRPEEAGQ